MCLDHIDRNIKPHDEGFKILRRLRPGIFTPTIFHETQYIFRKWFDAKTLNNNGNNKIKIIKTTDGKPYPAGFHYYLNLESAMSNMTFNEVVAQIKIKNILTTGFQNKEQVGVSEYMMLMKIVKDTMTNKDYRINPQINDIMTESLKPLLNILRHNHGKISNKTVQKIGELVSKTDEDFIDYITIVGSLKRQGEAFRIATEIHYRAINSVTKYSDYHSRVLSRHPDSSLLDKISTRENELYKQGYQNL